MPIGRRSPECEDRGVHVTLTPELMGFILGVEIGSLIGCLLMFVRSLHLPSGD